MAPLSWPRSLVRRADWEQLAGRLQGGELALLGLWGEPRQVHMAVMDSETNVCALLSLECPEGRFPSVGRVHPPALRLERAIRDLVGLEPEGLEDTRPWLRHDGTYRFLPAEGESLHQIPVGPVHAGIIEPGHFRFTANGETVVRLEERLGYTHKGVDALMLGATPERAAAYAGRISGDSTVAFALAFALALEAALQVEVPPRAVWLRVLLAELERLANHLGDIGAICNDAAFAIMNAQFSRLREHVLRAVDACLGHRLMMDRVVPGGLSRDLPPEGPGLLHALLARVRKELPDLVEVYENTPSLKDRTVGTGILSPDLARQYAAGGYVGRASGRDFDARRAPGYAPYEKLQFAVPVIHAGDVNARVWIRILEVEQSLALIEQVLAQIPPGAVYVPLAGPSASGTREGAALVEGFRGDILAWARLDAAGRIERCHMRDPSWFQWPLLEAAIEGNIVADFPLCNKSFNCSYSGHDL